MVWLSLFLWKIIMMESLKVYLLLIFWFCCGLLWSKLSYKHLKFLKFCQIGYGKLFIGHSENDSEARWTSWNHCMNFFFLQMLFLKCSLYSFNWFNLVSWFLIGKWVKVASNKICHSLFFLKKFLFLKNWIIC